MVGGASWRGRGAFTRLPLGCTLLVTRRASPRALSIVLAALGSTGCALFGTERHLAPVFTELSTAGGGTEVEALGGAARVRQVRPEGPVAQWALRPIVIHDIEPSGDFMTRFLTPLGTSESRGAEYTWQLLPVTRYHRRVLESGETEWQLLTLPGIYWSRQADGRVVRAWFPFAGVMEDFLSFDRLDFFLFPLFVRSEREGRIAYHFLFPVFSYTHGTGGPSWRVWPLYGHSKYAGRYDRHFALWPIWSFEKNRLWASPDRQETQWLLFPLLGRTTRGRYQATSILWPFFGYANDPETGFWSFDGPWPFVRIHRDPVNDVRRTRFWPLYSTYHGDGLDSTWYLFPIVNLRHEVYPQAEKNSVYVIPFWQSWKRFDDVAGRSSFQKLWPLYQVERTEEHSARTAFPALNPLWRTPEIDEMYAWIYELYTRDVNHEQVRERSWLGLYRREKDEHEDRASVVGLWARRRFTRQGEAMTETSLLFGLLRWRWRAAHSLQWMWPAVPGPGWPLERSPELRTASG